MMARNPQPAWSTPCRAVLALRLDVDFSEAGLLTHPAGVPFGDLILTNMANVQITSSLSRDYGAFDGLTVRQLLAQMETPLGGGGGLDGQHVISPRWTRPTFLSETFFRWLR